MEGDQPTGLCFQQVEGSLEAGHPYVFVPKQVGTLSFTAVHGEFVSKPIPTNGFYGTFKDISTSNTVLEGKYMINASNQFQKCGAGCSLKAYRAYLDMSKVPLKSQVAAPTRRVMRLSSNAAPEYTEPTGVGEINEMKTCTAHKQMVNGQIVIVKGNKQYSILGQAL